MYLGILATVAEQQPKNFYHFLLDNECYATTGGQPVPNAKVTRYDALARDVGYASTLAFDRLESFANAIERVLSAPAPAFVALKVRPEIKNVPVAQRKRWATRTRDQVRDDLQRALGIANERSS